jgi:hypothetical protein
MKYHQIDRDLFIKKQKKIYGSNEAKKSLPFNSNDIYPIGADSTMPFEQSRDILLKRRGSGRKHFIIISGLLMNTKRNIISKRNKRPYSRLGR